MLSQKLTHVIVSLENTLQIVLNIVIHVIPPKMRNSRTGCRIVDSPLLRMIGLAGSVLADHSQHFTQLSHGLDQVLLERILVIHIQYLQSSVEW